MRLINTYKVVHGNHPFKEWFRKNHCCVSFKHRKFLFEQKLRFHYTILYKNTLNISFLNDVTLMTAVFINSHF